MYQVLLICRRGLQHFQARGTHSLSGQPVPVPDLNHPSPGLKPLPLAHHCMPSRRVIGGLIQSLCPWSQYSL